MTWNESEDLLIKTHYPELGPNDLAVLLNRPKRCVVCRASKLKIRYKHHGRDAIVTRFKNKPSFWDQSKTNELISRYPNEGPNKLADEFGVSVRNITARANYLGLTTSTSAARRAQNSKSVNVNYFSGEWTANMAYLVGYILADGSIDDDIKTKQYALRLRCKESDGYFLEQIKHELNSNHKLSLKTTFNKKSNKKYKHWAIDITSKCIVKDLESKGVLPNKTYLNLGLPYVPDDLLGHLCRGFIDGDGCVWEDKRDGRAVVEICGTPKIIKAIRDKMCLFLGIKKNKLNVIEPSAVNLVKIVWSSHNDIIKIYNFLYPVEDSEYLCLKRKRDRLTSLLSE